MRFPRTPAVAATALACLLGATPLAYAAPTPTPTPAATASPGPTAGPQGLPAPARPGLTKLAVPAVARAALGDQEVVAALGQRATGPFAMLGVTWSSGTADPTVQVRTRTAAGWGDWAALAHEGDGPEGSTRRVGTAPTWTGDATGVEVRVLVARGATAPADLELTLIDPRRLASDAAPVTSRPPGSTRAAGTTQPAMPAVVTRSGWGADESLKAQSGADCMTPKIDSTIKAVVVHHTEGTNAYTAADSAAIVRGIYAFHVTGNGWCDIGYNFLVDRFGTIFEGRAGGMTLPVHGAHAVEWNTDTMGVSLMGNFMGQLPPEPALDAAARLTAWRLAAYYRRPTGTLTIGSRTSDVISGHRQVVETDCPGDALFAYLPTFRTRVQTLMGTAQTPIQARWLQLGGATGAAGQPREGEAAYAGGRVTRFANMDLYQRPDGRVVWTRGEVRRRYRDLGDASGRLGFPTTDENCTPAGCWQGFEGGVIIWSAATGAHPNWGAIRDKFGAMGFEGGELGYPTTDEVCSASGCYQGFQRGFLLFSVATGTHVSRDPLRPRFAQLGYESGWLGRPTTDDQCDPTGCWQDHQAGSLSWSAGRGAHFSRGRVRDRLLELGGRHGSLGYPSSDEDCGLRGGGCVQLFDEHAIYWSLATGAWENKGAIRGAYAAQGYENGRLGYPTGPERCDQVGCVQTFQGGTITFRWSGGLTVS